MSKSADGYGICTSHTTQRSPIFATTDDADYETLLRAIHNAAAYLEEIRRFDMPRFQPRAEDVRGMKRSGILPATLRADTAIGVYAADKAYWKSLWYRPATK